MKKNSKIEIGRLVKSTAGRDSEELYMIIKIEDKDFVLLCDGKYKKLENPKRKRIKHIETLSVVSVNLANKIKENKKIYNEEIYSQIKQFKENKGGA